MLIVGRSMSGILLTFNPLRAETVAEKNNMHLNRKCQDYVYMKGEYQSTMQKIKQNYRQENKVNENKVFYYEALIYMLKRN